MAKPVGCIVEHHRLKPLSLVEGVFSGDRRSVVFVTLQFPIVDARGFVSEATGRLSCPVWPAPMADFDFVRSFGMIRTRWSGGLSGWIGESEVCDARRALRLERLTPFYSPALGRPLPLKIAFRRFYYDGLAVAKYEIGIIVRYPDSPEPHPALPRELFVHLLELPVAIPNPRGQPRRCPLWQAGRALANLYTASSSHTTVSEDAIKEWVQPGGPILFVEYLASQRAKVPFWGKNATLPKYPDAVLSYHIFPLHGLNLRLWILNQSTLPKEEARKLRIALLRLHAEKECLRRILADLGSGRIRPQPRSQAADDLQRYLNNAICRILRLGDQTTLDTAPLPGDNMVEQVIDLEDAINPGERSSILAALERLDVRRNIYRKVERHLAPQQPEDVYSSYEIGLGQLLTRLDRSHPRYSEALVLQQRLMENIASSRRYGDTDSQRAQRAEIVDRLNDLTLSVLGTSFVALGHQANPPQ